MRILTFSTLYPNAAQPIHGIFVETRLRHLLAAGGVEAKVVAPVPWFPFPQAGFGGYARYAQVPREETRAGIEILHPRYPVLPKVGMTLAPWLLARFVASALQSLRRRYDFDLIDAHYFYPDGVAAVMLGRQLRRPVVVTGRGSDINLIGRHALPRRMIRWAAREAAGVVTVSRALKDSLAALGVPGARIEVLRNGVDLDLFRPVERAAVRERLGMRRTTLLSVGNLHELKGHGLVIGALAELPQCDLVVIGDGPEREALARLAERAGLGARVRFLGQLPQERLREYYGAADALVLASSREGWPNVLLESMACGTAVIASDVGGCAEAVAAPEAGRLLRDRSAHGVAAAVRELLERPPQREATRRYAERFGWGATSRGQLELFGRVAACSRGPAGTAAAAR